MPRTGQRHSLKSRGRISRGVRRQLAVKRDQELLVPRLAAFRRRRGCDALHRALLARAAEEAVAIVEALGGLEVVSPQRLRLVEDAAIAGVILGREFGEYQKNRDPEAAARVVSLINARRSTYVQIGLDRVKVETDVTAYAEAVRAHSNPATGSGQ